MPTFIDAHINTSKTAQKTDYLPVVMKGFSWIALILSPWAFLAFFANAIGIMSLTLSEQVLVYTISIAVIPQFFSAMQRT